MAVSTSSNSVADAYDTLRDAVVAGDLNLVSQLMKDEPENFNDAKQNPSLICSACASQHSDLVELFLAWRKNMTFVRKLSDWQSFLLQQCDPAYPDDRGRTALHYSSLTDNFDIVQVMIKDSNENESFIDKQENYGITALMLSALNGHEHVTELLLENNASVDIQDVNGLTALILSTLNRHDKVAELLLKYEASADIQDNAGDTALILSAKNGYDKVTKVLLICKASADIRNKHGVTALMASAQNDHGQVTELLLKYKASADVKDNSGDTALMLSAQKGHYEITELLLKYHASVDIQNNQGLTALVASVNYGHDKVTELLLEHKASPDIQNSGGSTALMLSALDGHDKITELLLMYKASTDIQNDDGITALIISALSGYDKITELLLMYKACADIQNKDGVTALMASAQNGHDKVTELLLRYKACADIQNNKGLTALMASAQFGHDKVSEHLLKHKASANLRSKRGNTALTVSAQYNNYNITELLLKNKAIADIQDNDGSTALMVSAQHGHDKVTELLLKYNASAEIQTNEGFTALMVSAQYGHEKVTELLLQHEVSVDIQNKSGYTALMWSAQNGHRKVTELLLENEASVDVQNNGGNTALIFSANAGHAEIIELLLSCKASVDIQNDDGYTALMASAQNGHDKVTELLLENKASVDVQNNGGNTALNLSALAGHDKIIELLLTYKASADIQNKDGATALMLLCQSNYSNFSELIFSANPKLDLIDNFGQTALSYASDASNQHAMLALLQNDVLCDIHTREGNTALTIAVQNGFKQVMTLLLDKNVPSNARNISKDTPLLIAVRMGDIESVSALLRHGSLNNITDAHEKNSIMIATEFGFSEILELLLQHDKTAIDHTNMKEETALMMSVESKKVESMKILLTNGASINLQEKDGCTALMKAVLCGAKANVAVRDLLSNSEVMIATNEQSIHIEIVRILLRFSASPNISNIYGTTPLMLCAYNGFDSIMEMLITHGAEINREDKEGHTALMVAVDRGHIGVVCKLLHHGASAGVCRPDGSTLLMTTIEKGHTELVDLLLEEKLPLDLFRDDDESALMIAIEKSEAVIVEKLLMKGVSLNIANAKGVTALMTAARVGDTRMIQMLLDNGACDVRCDGDSIGCTALSIASQNGNNCVLDILLSNNVRVPIHQKYTLTTLLMNLDTCPDHTAEIILDHILEHKYEQETVLFHLAAEHDKTYVAELLLQRGVSVDVQDEQGNSALISAARTDNISTAKLLLAQKAAVDHQNRAGKTALILAAEHGNVGVAELLLKSNASTSLKDNNGYTVAQSAIANGSSQVSQLLLKHAQSEISDAIIMQLKHMDRSTITEMLVSGQDLVFLCPVFDGMPYVHYVVDRGDIGVMEFILEQGINPNVYNNEGCTPLFTACARDDIESVRLLLRHKAEVDIEAYDGSTPMSIADEKGHSDILKLLVHLSKETNLLTAAMCGSVQLLKVLLQQGANVNEQFANRQTALHEVSYRGNVQCIELLRDSGAKANICDIWGNFPLHMAAQSGSFKALKTILQMDHSLINMQNQINRWSPLHMAIREGPKSKSVSALKKANAQQVLPDHEGHTADYYINFGKRLYHKDEHPQRDILGNMRCFDDKDLSVCPQMMENVKFGEAIQIVEKIRSQLENEVDSGTSFKEDLYRILTTRGCGIKCSDHQVKPVELAVHRLLNRIQSSMEKEHLKCHSSSLKLELCISGSVHEGTKVGLPDEFDCQIILNDLEGCMEVVREREHGLTVQIMKYNEGSHPLSDYINKVDEQGHIKPGLYNYLYTLLCRSLADTKTFQGLPLCFKNITKEQIHLEWRGDHFLMMALKIDIVFAVRMSDWYPQEGRPDSLLLEKACREHGMRLLLRGLSWRPTFCDIENKIMKELPAVVKLAYQVSKVINNFLAYDKSQLHYRVKSYDLKNAVMYVMDEYCAERGSTLLQCSLELEQAAMQSQAESNKEPTAATVDTTIEHEHDMSKTGRGEYPKLLKSQEMEKENVTDDERILPFSEHSDAGSSIQEASTPRGVADSLAMMKDEHFSRSVCEWTRRICDQGLKKLLTEGGGRPYYFGLGHTRMRRSAVERLMKYVNFLCDQN